MLGRGGGHSRLPRVLRRRLPPFNRVGRRQPAPGPVCADGINRSSCSARSALPLLGFLERVVFMPTPFPLGRPATSAWPAADFSISEAVPRVFDGLLRRRTKRGQPLFVIRDSQLRGLADRPDVKRQRGAPKDLHHLVGRQAGRDKLAHRARTGVRPVGRNALGVQISPTNCARSGAAPVSSACRTRAIGLFRGHSRSECFPRRSHPLPRVATFTLSNI